VQYTENYPDEAPLLDLFAPQNAPKHPYFDLSQDRDRLLRGLHDAIEDNLGMAMVFTLVSSVKEEAESLVRERAAETRRESERKFAEAEAAENAKFHGTVVTKERFLEWRENFRKELEDEKRRKEEEAAEEMKKKKAAKEEAKLTGRQLWERGLAGKGDEDDEDVDAMDKLKISEETKVAV